MNEDLRQRLLRIPSYVSIGECEELQRIAEYSGDVLEVGSWLGRSTVALSWAMDINRHLCCVDTFKSCDIMPGLDFHAQFSDNIAKYAKHGEDYFLTVHAVSWEQFIADDKIRPPIEKFGLVFLDADHGLMQTVHQMQAFLPVVMAGGTMCVHDYATEFPSVRQAVDFMREKHGLSLRIVNRMAVLTKGEN